MFGMYDWQSRIISFFMRVAQIIGRSIAMLVMFILAIVALALYVVILPITVGLVVYNFTGALI